MKPALKLFSLFCAETSYLVTRFVDFIRYLVKQRSK